MKYLLTLLSVIIISFTGYAQAPAYHWEINGKPAPGATSVAFVCDLPNHKKDSAVKYDQIIYAGKLLHRYKYYHMTGNLLQIGGASIAFINLLEMNRTKNPVSGYMPMYVVGGGLALAGYILNGWIAPGFITKAGLSLQGNTLSINLD